MSHESLEHRVAEALAAAAQDPVLGLGDPDAARQRLIEAQVSPSGTRLVIASDGLSLAQKEALERRLAEVARESGHEAPVVYFKRRAPVPVTRPAPFGLTPAKRPIPGVRRVLVVASGKGGVGKSTVSTNLAVALARRGRRVGLLDADVYGPSVPLMLGLDGPMAVGPRDRLVPREAHGVKTVSFGFLSDTRQPVIWRGPMVGKALKQFCYDVEWGELDELIVDLPPGTGDVQLTLIESLPIAGAVIVTTPQDVALIDAHKALSMFEKLEVPVLGVIENMSYFHCPQCGHAEHLFGEGGGEKLADSRRAPFLGGVPLARAVREAGDAGRPIAMTPESPAAAAFDEIAAKLVTADASAP